MQNKLSRFFGFAGLLLTGCFCLNVHEGLAGPITFEKTGYSIDVLDSGPVQAGGQAALQMFLPAQDGFASNVNVQYQAFEGTFEEYAQFSRSSFEQLGWTLMSEKFGADYYAAEGFGLFGQRALPLYFYFRAVKSGTNIILATATAPQNRWDQDKILLMPVIDSLKTLP